MELTNKECKALVTLVEHGIEGNGAETLEEMIEDNYSWFETSTLMERLTINRHQASGIMSALDAKGLAVDSEGGNGNKYIIADHKVPTWYLTEEGLREGFKIRDARQSMINTRNELEPSEGRKISEMEQLRKIIETKKAILESYGDVDHDGTTLTNSIAGNRRVGAIEAYEELLVRMDMIEAPPQTEKPANLAIGEKVRGEAFEMKLGTRI